MSEKINNLLGLSVQALRKVITSGGQLKATFSLTKGRSINGLAVFLASRDPDGSKSKAAVKTLKTETSATKRAVGLVYFENKKLYFQVTQGDLKGAVAQKTLRKGFLNAPKPLVNILKRAIVVVEGAENNEGVDQPSTVTPASASSDEDVFDIESFKRETISDIENDATLSEEQKRVLIDDLNEVEEVADVLSEVIRLVEEVTAAFLEEEELDAPRLAPPPPIVRITGEEGLSEIRQLVDNSGQQLEISGLNVLDAPEVLTTVPGLSEVVVNLNNASTVIEDLVSRRAAFKSDVRLRHTALKECLARQFAAMESSLTNKGEDQGNFNKIVVHVKNDLIGPYESRIDTAVDAINDYSMDTEILFALSKSTEFNQYISRSFKISVLDDCIENVNFHSELMPAIQNLIDMLKSHEKLQ